MKLTKKLVGVMFNWKGLKEENYLYDKEVFLTICPDEEVKARIVATGEAEGSFAANKTYIAKEITTMEELEKFLNGEYNEEDVENPSPDSDWYWDNCSDDLFGKAAPTAMEASLSIFKLRNAYKKGYAIFRNGVEVESCSEITVDTYGMYYQTKSRENGKRIFLEKINEEECYLGISTDHIFRIYTGVTPIGLVAVSEGETYLLPADNIYVEWVELTDQYKGQGYLKKVLKAVTDKFGSSVIVLESNDEHLSMYQHLGFEKVEYDEMREMTKLHLNLNEMSSVSNYVVTIGNEYLRDQEVLSPDGELDDESSSDDNNWKDFSANAFLGCYTWKDNDIAGLREYCAKRYGVPMQIVNAAKSA